jgi:hypothetical protein
MLLPLLLLQGTCLDEDAGVPDNQTFICPDFTLFNQGNAAQGPPTDSLCCLVSTLCCFN